MRQKVTVFVFVVSCVNLTEIYSFCLQQGLPVFAIGVGLSTFDKASVRLFYNIPFLQLLLDLKLHKRVLWFILMYLLQVNYYVQSHIQINEYRDRVILVRIVFYIVH